MKRKHRHEIAGRLLVQDSYHPEELADLLDMDVKLLRHAAFAGDLKAVVIDHHIISIRRKDMLDWLAQRAEH